MQYIAPSTSISPVKFERWTERLRDGLSAITLSQGARTAMVEKVITSSENVVDFARYQVDRNAGKARAPLGAGPESILPVVVMDSGLARSLSSGGAERRPVGAPRNDEKLNFAHDYSRHRPDRGQRRRLCPRAARRRDSGRTGCGDRRAERAAGDRDRQPRRCLHDAGGHLRQAP